MMFRWVWVALTGLLALVGTALWVERERPTVLKLGATPIPPPKPVTAAWEQTARCVSTGSLSGWAWFVADTIPWPHEYPDCPQCAVDGLTLYRERAIVLRRTVLADSVRLPVVVRHELLHVRLGAPPVGTAPGWHNPVFLDPRCGPP